MRVRVSPSSRLSAGSLIGKTRASKTLRCGFESCPACVKFKVWFVDFLDRACFLVDKLPDWTYPFIGRFIGCPKGMSLWAFKLMDRWDLPSKVLDNSQDVC